jgi:hypothetical protein
MERTVVYTAIFFNEEELKRMFKPVHENLFYHHSTIGFQPQGVDELPLDKKVKIKILGRLTTKKVDVLLVDNNFSKNKHPHITLSTAKDIKPQESNTEIEKYYDRIKDLKPKKLFIWGRIGYFDGQKEITKENKIIGGLSDKKTLEDLSKKHNIHLEKLKKQLEIGINVEMEHTNNKEIAKEIALDHLFELPDYYTKLKTIEESLFNKIILEELDQVFSTKEVINKIDEILKGDKNNGISYNREIYGYDIDDNMKHIYVDINKNNTKHLFNKNVIMMGFDLVGSNSDSSSTSIMRLIPDNNKENGIWEYLGHGNEYGIVSRFNGDFYKDLLYYIKSNYKFGRFDEKSYNEPKNEPVMKNDKKIDIPSGFITIIKDILKKQANNYVSKIVATIERNEGKGTQRQYDYLKRFRSGELGQSNYSSKN